MGGLDLCVNCAGVAAEAHGRQDGPSGDFFRKVIEINLVGTLLVCKQAAAEMQKNRRTPTANAARS